MKKKWFIFPLVLLLMLGLSLTSIVPTALAKSKKAEFHWKVQTAWPAGCAMNFAAKHFFNLVKCYSGGRISYTFHTAGEIVPSFEVWDAVSKGVLDAGHACNCYTIGRSWASAMFCAVPFPVGPAGGVMRLLWLYEGGGNELHDEIVGKYYNVKGFPADPVGTETWLYSTKKFKSMADLRKMKIRSTGIRAAIFNEAGVKTVSLPGGELIPSMQKGVVDAVEYSLLSWDWPLGFSDVTKYVYFSQVPMTGCLYGFVNKKRWNELPPDLKKAVKKAGFDSGLWSLKWTEYMDTKFAHNIAEAGKVEVLFVPDNIEKEMEAAAKRLFKKRYEKNPEVRKIMDSWKKFFIDDKWAQYRKFMQVTQ